ncbi:MAG: prolipoprotein diacylglyceryl transferase [Elusimicrobiota bacterium]|jgi:phosphatidylglycerol:prolipoprotein diacylglycerol transferase|nr:prolipoprotein diacylglyceryl transferase [Elusimicrobiota bacterium]
MHPILFSIGGFTLYSYGFFVALGFAAGMFYLSYQAKKSPQIISQDDLFNLLFWIIISGIAGARLLYVIAENRSLFRTPLEIFAIWEGGLTFYGGFIAAALAAFFYIKRKKLNIAKVMDLLAPAIALGHFLGRIGCFMAGCCFGKPTNMPWGIVFRDPHSLSMIKGIPVHPAELYESFSNLILFILLHLYNKKKHKDGLAIGAYLTAYAVCRFIIEFFRGDYRGTVVFGLSTSQFISVFVFIIGLTIVYRVNRNAENKI